MRSTWWIVVVIAGVALFGMLRVSSGSARQRQVTARAEEKKKFEPVAVEGYGQTEQSARAVALRKAQQEVSKAVLEQVGLEVPTALLTLERLEKHGVIDSGEKPTPDPKADNALRARYNILVTDEYVAEVRKEIRREAIVQEKQQRQENTQWRELMLARGLGGMVVLLLVITGYLRLEEATRGYYTHLLRLTALAVVALAGVGLWLSL